MATYNIILSKLKEAEPLLNPRTIMVDFEKAAMEAVKASFPDTTVKGCYFHFCQCIYRHVQRFGLQAEYQKNANCLQHIAYSLHCGARIHSNCGCMQELQFAQRIRILQNQIEAEEKQRIPWSVQVRRGDVDWKSERRRPIHKRSFHLGQLEYVRNGTKWIAANQQCHWRLA